MKRILFVPTPLGGILRVACLLGMLASCSKRLNYPIPSAPGTINPSVGSNSPIGMINLYGLYPADISVNGRQITTFTFSGTGPVGPTLWFPSGQMAYGQLFTFPDSLFDRQGNAAVNVYTTIRTKSYLYDSTILNESVQVRDNPDSPRLLIRFPRYTAPPPNILPVPVYTTDLVNIPGSITPPSQPDHFKVRIINLAGKPTPGAYDALTLVYADGTPVAPQTTGVGFRQASDYADLPYGTDQLRIVDASGKPIEEYPGPYLDSAGLPVGLSGMPYDNIRTWLPGGMYTFVVSWQGFNYGYDANSEWDYPSTVLLHDNSVNSAPNYIRLDAVNALPDHGAVHFTVDGQDLGGFLDFGRYSDYGIFSIGPHKVSLTDASNHTLATLQLDTWSMDNLTLWAWQDGGQVKLTTTANDFSNMGEFPSLTIGFEPQLPNQKGFGWACRFINLSDVPYATFLDQTGSFLDGSPSFATNWDVNYRNVAAGYVASTNPYVGYSMAALTNPYGPPLTGNGAVITAYRNPSAGDTTCIPLGLSLDHPMVLHPGSYARPPAAEPGIYTIALIGKAGSSDPSDKARLIVIKHNK